MANLKIQANRTKQQRGWNKMGVLFQSLCFMGSNVESYLLYGVVMWRATCFMGNNGESYLLYGVAMWRATYW